MNNAGMEAELRRLNMKPEKTSDNSPNRSTIERFFSGLSEYIFPVKTGRRRRAVNRLPQRHDASIHQNRFAQPRPPLKRTPRD